MEVGERFELSRPKATSFQEKHRYPESFGLSHHNQQVRESNSTHRALEAQSPALEHALLFWYRHRCRSLTIKCLI